MTSDPHQSQIDRMQEISELHMKAQENGFWLETISLTYILIGVELRILLFQRGVSEAIVTRQRQLMELATLAKGRGFIGQRLWGKIQGLEEDKNEASDQFARGEIEYAELETSARAFTELVLEIHSKYLKQE